MPGVKLAISLAAMLVLTLFESLQEFCRWFWIMLSFEIYFKSRSWSVRQPSAKKVVRKILADKELRTPVKVIETLAKMVPSAVELTRTGVAPELLASVLAVNHEDDRLFQDFQ